MVCHFCETCTSHAQQTSYLCAVNHCQWFGRKNTCTHLEQSCPCLQIWYRSALLGLRSISPIMMHSMIESYDSRSKRRHMMAVKKIFYLGSLEQIEKCECTAYVSLVWLSRLTVSLTDQVRHDDPSSDHQRVDFMAVLLKQLIWIDNWLGIKQMLDLFH